MELTKQVGAALAALVATSVLFMVSSPRAGETSPGKLQHRLSMDRLVVSGAARQPDVTGHDVAPDSSAHRRREDRLSILPGGCVMASSGEIPLRCLFGSREEGVEHAVRMITIETRVGVNISVLSRVPADLTAR